MASTARVADSAMAARRAETRFTLPCCHSDFARPDCVGHPARPASRPTAVSAAGRRRFAPSRSTPWSPRRRRSSARRIARRRSSASSATSVAASPSCSACPTGWEIVLGNGGTTVFWDVATFGLVERRSQHLVFGEFSSKFADACAAAPHPRRPRRSSRPTPATIPMRSPTPTVDVYALTHNETSTGVAMHAAPAGAGERRPARPRRRHVGSRRPAVGPGRGRRLLLRAAEVLRRRRRTVDRGLLAGGDRAHRADRRLRAVAPRLARPGHRPRQQPARPDLQHAGRHDAGAVRRAALVDARARWAGGVRQAVAGVGGASLRLGRGDRLGDAVRRRPGEALQRRRHDRPRRHDRRQPSSTPRCGPTASSTPTATASSGATRSASACSRRSRRPTSSP